MLSPHVYINIFCTETFGLAVLAGFSCLCILGSSLSVYVCHPRGALLAYWASGYSVSPGISRSARKLAWTPRVIKIFFSLIKLEIFFCLIKKCWNMIKKRWGWIIKTCWILRREGFKSLFSTIYLFSKFF